ncbi:hypothetical protein G6O67_005814 [Ophiocordyceps sinensis]|uniref:Charged multivesicular body protein 3 n=2 Tax=Ophiocordyceps sinensis TaxID=72228 RepID=A0A8H4PNG0_9HYPO|nr:hypothetical protein G6O67_005814 [Ophiocordyceps sinensis]
MRSKVEPTLGRQWQPEVLFTQRAPEHATPASVSTRSLQSNGHQPQRPGSRSLGGAPHIRSLTQRHPIASTRADASGTATLHPGPAAAILLSARTHARTRSQPSPPVSAPAPATATFAAMDTIKSLFSKPDPQAQVRKCNALIRSNIRKLDRDIVAVRQGEAKAKNLIVQADKRSQRDPTRAKQAQKEVRDFARELVRARRTSSRLVTSKAQLNSVQMQVNEAFAVRKIEGSIRASVGIMKDVNSLIRLPKLSGTMHELSVELMRAGIIEEMVEDTLPEDGDMLLEDDEAEAEVDKVLGEILKDRKEPSLPAAPVPEPQKPVAAAEEEDEEEDAEAMMDQMRDRLDALRS